MSDSACESAANRLHTGDSSWYFYQDFYDFSHGHGETCGEVHASCREVYRFCSLSESGFIRLNDSEVCILKRGVIRRSGVNKAFSLRL
jgi:hypothetical protein